MLIIRVTDSTARGIFQFFESNKWNGACWTAMESVLEMRMIGRGRKTRFFTSFNLFSMNTLIIEGLQRQKNYAKHRFSAIRADILDDILQDLFSEILTSAKLFDSLAEELKYWTRAFFNKCCDFLNALYAAQHPKVKTPQKPRKRWVNPKYRAKELVFRTFTINDLMAELNRQGRMTMEIRCCILCDAQDFKRSRVCEMHGINRKRINKLILKGREELEEILLSQYLIEARDLCN